MPRSTPLLLSWTAAALLALPAAASTDLPLDRAGAPDFDVHALDTAVRGITPAQSAALDALAAEHSDLTVRWNDRAGSPAVVTDFATAPSAASPESIARGFFASHAAIFGVAAEDLELVVERPALGGTVLRFAQRHDGLPVVGSGLGGFVDSDGRLLAVFGPSAPGLAVSSSPTVGAAAAVAAAEADISRHAIWRSGEAAPLLAPGLAALDEVVAGFLPEPSLAVVPTGDGARLVWNVATWSTNPFGLYLTQVDAHSGELVSRRDFVHQIGPSVLPFTADVYPNHPVLADLDTGELALDGNGEPEGLLRVELRSLGSDAAATGTAGLLAGDHALVKNTLATMQPFAQSAAHTFHFRNQNPPLEAHPNEIDDLAEPSEHIDEVNIFFFITYLIEYLEDLHVRADGEHNPFGDGDFPDTYPNSDVPLVGLVHIPNVYLALGAEPDTSSPEGIVGSVLGLDNAFSLNVTGLVEGVTGTPLEAGGQPLAVNPTSYGHGYLFNDLAKDGAVAYHEGMHSISSPIAGLEGAIEGNALNEAQADMWAYTITDASSIGEYTVSAARLRQLFRDLGRDPDSLAWIRSAYSTLRYSELGTYRGTQFEEHRDGEIPAAAFFALREMMIASEPDLAFERPSFVDGQPTRRISVGQDSFERIFLGALYLLGASPDDTFVKTRDALLLADRVLYPSGAGPTAQGVHAPLIWQVFAARELGVNAAAPIGGRQTISTEVPPARSAPSTVPAAPGGVGVARVGSDGLRITWNAVPGAYAYEVTKRVMSRENERPFAGVPGREYHEGDAVVDGWSHAAFVTTTSWDDLGPIEGIFAPAGLSADGPVHELIGVEYSVRALGLDAAGRTTVSPRAAAAWLPSRTVRLDRDLEVRISNVSFEGGLFAFDQTLTNVSERTVMNPLSFEIVAISDSTVTVANADNCANGQSARARFGYTETLAPGEESAPRRLVFANPQGRLFTYTARVTGRVEVAPNRATRWEADPGRDLSCYSSGSSSFTTAGIVPGSDTGLQLVAGVTYVDVPVTTEPGAYVLSADLTSQLGVDLDLYLLSASGSELAASETGGTSEQVTAPVSELSDYTVRIVGWVGAAQDYELTVTQQTLVPSATSALQFQAPAERATTGLAFTVDPRAPEAVRRLR